MAKRDIDKRVVFPRGKQAEFFDSVLEQLTVSQVASLCGVCHRTIRDWRREKFSIDAHAFLLLCKKANILPSKNVEFKDRYWYVSKGAGLGWAAVKRKYGRVPGNEEYRKKKWYEWWEQKGRHERKDFFCAKDVIKPPYSEDLAEFVGIVLGDGGISKNQVVITLHKKDDAEYGNFVTTLVYSLFGVPVSRCPNKYDNGCGFIISRIELVRFCVKELGLKIGNKVKQQVDVPEWIKRNTKYKIACTRGLMDTDGSIFTHSYTVNGKRYKYKKLSFNNSSKPLVQCVYGVFKDAGLISRVARQEKEVRIDSIACMEKYFQIIGSHNPKHLKRYQN